MTYEFDDRRPWQYVARYEAIRFSEHPALFVTLGIEWALVAFDNGWTFSILRNCRRTGPHAGYLPEADFDCARRAPDGTVETDLRFAGLAELQAELDRLATLPDATPLQLSSGIPPEEIP